MSPAAVGKRRRALRLLSATTALALAGCAGELTATSTDTDADQTDQTTAPTVTATDPVDDTAPSIGGGTPNPDENEEDLPGTRSAPLLTYSTTSRYGCSASTTWYVNGEALEQRRGLLQDCRGTFVGRLADTELEELLEFFANPEPFVREIDDGGSPTGCETGDDDPVNSSASLTFFDETRHPYLRMCAEDVPADHLLGSLLPTLRPATTFD